MGRGRRSIAHSLMIMGAVAAAVLAAVQPARAQDPEAGELIALVNELRASKGLEPYTVDAGLMAMAQEHSDYQASIGTSTHVHSDGSWPPDLGVGENVAEGDIGYLTPRAAVYEVWAGWGHMVTMVGNTSGSMGVGVANDGKRTYYTLEVRPPYMPGSSSGPRTTGAGPTGTTAVGPVGTAAEMTPIPVATLAAATPLADGTIVHVVGYGHTLWAIAQVYGVQIEQIRAWNNMAADANEIYVGQKLLVRPASLVTPSATATVTEEVRATETATATVEPSATATEVSTAAATEGETGGERGDGSGVLVPLAAGGGVVVGVVMLVWVGRRRKRF